MFHILFISLLYIIVCIVEMPKYTIKDALLEVMGTNEITFFTRFVNLKHSKEDATTKLEMIGTLSGRALAENF